MFSVAQGARRAVGRALPGIPKLNDVRATRLCPFIHPDRLQIDAVWQSVLDRCLPNGIYDYRKFPDPPSHVHIINNAKEAEMVVAAMYNRRHDTIALDIEERPHLRPKEDVHCDVVQLRDDEALVVLHLASMGMSRGE